ncbi:glutamyl-tRNA reductase [Thermostichus vulcanus]|uniref:Glutamyl-tRNA reductase n=1 Tax=Thermostichus vulcanus str. 'Rupite' TaxID=2813851 RepID=A0ABT0CBP5_THEVL|nr:glutamyl-tRNA reductase [Thermostichus vulcanus]MCJ2543193.1 glutamyl-tRNA reductase [Thermostichus vulcanus str. 'Rupite']
MFIAVVGLSHRTAPVEIREQLSIPEMEVGETIQQLCAYPHIEEAAILSTCNRLEVYIVTPEMESGVRQTMQFLAESKGIPLAQLRPHLFTLIYQDAAMHLMRVAAGLDSLVLGEGQILSQVKKAQQLGQACNGMDRILNRLFKAAITAGKRIRTETEIGTGAMSISSAAVELALQEQGSLSQGKITVVGAGKMSRLLVQHLLAKGAVDITVVNRSLERAQDLVKQFEQPIQVLPWDDLLSSVAESNLVFTSTGATQPILNYQQLEAVLQPDQPILLVDISVPRNIDPDVEKLKGAQVFNVDHLSRIVEENRAQRQKLALAAEALIEEEVEQFMEWWRSLETVPTISSLRHKVESIREQEMEKALSRLGQDFAEKHLEVIDALTRGIVNKILHDPMVQLRAKRDIEARRAAMHTLQELFNLDPMLFQAQQER